MFVSVLERQRASHPGDTIFTADCLRYPIQMVGIETIWELHTLTVINSCIYKQVWTPVVRETLPVDTEEDDANDPSTSNVWFCCRAFMA